MVDRTLPPVLGIIEIIAERNVGDRLKGDILGFIQNKPIPDGFVENTPENRARISEEILGRPLAREITPVMLKAAWVEFRKSFPHGWGADKEPVPGFKEAIEAALKAGGYL